METDHRARESILRKSLWSAPRCLQMMMMRLQNFDFKVEYKKGTLRHVADTLSRAYLRWSMDTLLNLHGSHWLNYVQKL